MNNLCYLCNKKSADKSGSHIIPAFLIESMHNISGKKGRDYECSYTIDSANAEIFIGRNVLPEKIEEIMGHESDPEEIQKLKNQYVRDNIFCTDCENRFSTIESFYSSNFNKYLINKAISEKRKEILLSDNKYFRLFWLSVIWRCSIAKHGTFQLKEKFEEQIRKLLDKYLDVELINLRHNLEDECNDLLKLPLTVFFAPFNPNPTGNFVFLHPMLNKPYLGLINEYVVLLYEKSGHVGVINQSFFSLERKYSLKKLANINEGTFHINVISQSDWLEIIENVVNFKKDDFIDELKTRFSKLFCALFNQNPSQEILTEFLEEWKKGDYSFAERYSKSYITNVAITCIYKYAK